MVSFKINKLNIIIFLIVLVILIINSILVVNIIGNMTTLKLIKNIDSKEIRDSQFIDILIEKFANNHNYSKEYKCLNYSSDLNYILVSLGYESVEVIGHNNITGHSWNRITIDIDPQLGEYTDNNKIFYIAYKP